MRIEEEIRQAIAGYIRAHQQLGVILKTGEDGWRKRYLAIRRDMAEQVSALVKLTHRLQSSGVYPATVEEFQSRLSYMRHCIALHQSKWPVVTIDPQSSEYRASLKRLDDARRAVIMSCDDLLKEMEDSK